MPPLPAAVPLRYGLMGVQRPKDWNEKCSESTSSGSRHGIPAGVGKDNNGKSDEYMDEKPLKKP